MPSAYLIYRYAEGFLVTVFSRRKPFQAGENGFRLLKTVKKGEEDENL